MKRFLHQLVRLYPPSWRENYESELRALLDAAEPRWTDAFDLIKEVLQMRLSHLGPVSLAVLGAATATLLTVAAYQLKPVQWESQAILSIRVPPTPFDPTQSHMPAVNYLTMSQRVLGKSSLLRILDRERLYPELRTKDLSDSAIERLRQNIVITPLWGLAGGGGSGMFAVAFRDRDPYVSNQVTRDLATSFEDETVRVFDVIKSGLVTAGIPPELAPKPAMTLEFFYPAKHSAANWPLVIGLALAEGSQLGLIFALLRRRAVAYT